MNRKARVRVAIVGTASRASYMYTPVLKGLSDHIELVAVWGRSAASAQRLGETADVPWYTDLDLLIRETAPQIGVVCVAYGANGQVGLMALEHGLHVLVETPIAHRLSEADAMIQTAERRGLKIEVSEQFHRRPLEQIKLKLLASGLFGRVYSSFNDFAGHGYHGISVMRSYLGFDARPVQVTGAVRKYDLSPHWSALSGRVEGRTESQEHGVIEFEGGTLGIFHWTSVGYDCPLRWWRSSRFLAENGMGITTGVGLDTQEKLSLLSPGNEGPHFITLERRYERVDGGALASLVAHTGDPRIPVVRWDNPFLADQKGQSVQWHDDEIGVAGCVMSLVKAVRSGGEPSYGPQQARLDQELILAIRESSIRGGQPVTIPLDPTAQRV